MGEHVDHYFKQQGNSGQRERQQVHLGGSWVEPSLCSSPAGGSVYSSTRFYLPF